MHPTILTEIMNVRTHELHQQAHQGRLARAAKQGRKALRAHRTPRVRSGLRPWPVMHRPAI